MEWTPTKSPFPGLRPFKEDDGPIFFGRGRETDELVKRVNDSPFVAVIGASGSGKSSLVRAGLIPRLKANAISNKTTGSKAQFIPGSDPFEALATTLMESVPALVCDSPRKYAKELEDFSRDLAINSAYLSKTVTRALKDEKTWTEVLLFIDQFEELFTLVKPEQRKAFIHMLAIPTPRLRIITMRSDFYSRAVEYPELSELLRTGSFPLAAPKRDALRQMIERPAERAGVEIEQGLIEQLLDDTGDEPGNLALLAYALDGLYKIAADQGDRCITFNDYKTLGTVAGAIGKRAEAAFTALPDNDLVKEQALARVFQQLVEVDENGIATRQRAAQNRFGEDERRLINAFTEARLLVTSNEYIEVAHEALFSSWERLVQWLQKSREDLRFQKSISDDVSDLVHADKPLKYDKFYRGDLLEEAQRRAKARMPNADEIEFLQESSKQQEQERQRERNLERRANFALRILAIMSFVAMLGAFGLTGFALNESRNTQNARATSEANFW